MSHRFNTNEDAFASFVQGNRQGFAHFFDRLYPALSYFAFQVLKDRPEAEDVADESFIKAWEQRHRFTNPQNLKSFLYRTTRNASIDILRRRKRYASIQKELQYLSDKESSAIDREIIRAESLASIHASLDILPPQCRRVFSMIYIDGKSTTEISQELNITVNNIRVLKAKALSLLRSRVLRMVIVFISLFSR